MTIPEEIEKLKTILEQTTDDREQAGVLMEILKKIASVKSSDSQPYIDRLLHLAEKLNEPVYKAWGLYHEGILKRFRGEMAAAIVIANEAKDIFTRLGEKHGMAISYNNLGLVYFFQGHYHEALKNQASALKLREEIGDKSGIASAYVNIGMIYKNQGHYPEALKNYLTALAIHEEIGDNKGIAVTSYSIGMLYDKHENFPEALKKLYNAKKLFEEAGDIYGLLHTYSGLGTVYFGQGDYPEALKNHFESLKIKEGIGDKQGISTSYNNIGHIYQKEGNLPEALKNYFASLRLKQEIGEKSGIATALNSIGSIYYSLGDHREALKNHSEALKIGEEIGHKEMIKNASQALSECYTLLEEYENALFYYKKYHEAEKELQGEESQKQLNDLQFMHNLEQKEKDAAYEKQKREESEHLRKIVEQKNTELIQSINYALKIQSAILPGEGKIKQYFPDSFVLYLPKDIVSGDFYWMEEVSPQTPEGGLNTRGAAVEAPFGGLGAPLILFAACDCTGHGVPGAMVSLVCHNALNRAVHEFGITRPSLILDKVCELVVESFTTSPQTPEGGLNEGVRDGMDISLCALDPQTRTLQWAGANSPLWLMRNNEITEIKADKQPIGATDYGSRFTNHSIQLQSGDVLYLFSDGYADQFGGADGKKLTRKRMKQSLLDIKKLPLSEQGKNLRDFILHYKKDTFQTDDILLMGLKIN